MYNDSRHRLGASVIILSAAEVLCLTTARARATVFTVQEIASKLVAGHRHTFRMMHATMLDIPIVIGNAEYRAQRPRDRISKRDDLTHGESG